MNREQEIVQRSQAFRQQYRTETPGWYRGEMHLAFTLCFTGGVLGYCAAKLSAPTADSERREQLIYLIGQLRHPDERAQAFVEDVLRTPDTPYDQKGRAILAIGSLYPPGWEKWKRVFEQVALANFNGISAEPKDQNESLYLQTKSLQSLAEIGDLQTLETLRKGRQQWPIELERVFYSTSEEIVWRNSG